MNRLGRWLNDRLHIVASEEESAYYAWADEWLDEQARLTTEHRRAVRVESEPKRKRLGELICIVTGHVVAYGPCPRCNRRQR